MIGQQTANRNPRPVRFFAHLIIARAEAQNDSRYRSVKQASVAREVGALHPVDRSGLKAGAKNRAHREAN
jgi:hypothetical protein